MTRTSRIGLALAAALTLTLLVSSQASSVEKFGPFRGQLVDVETGQPIAGAAILVIWWEAIFSPVGHPTERFYDAREAVTDAEGRFDIPRLSVPFWKLGIQAGQVLYFAVGYEPHGKVVTPPDGQPFAAPTVVQMRRLKTREELLQKSRGYRSQIPAEKMREFLKAINIERRMLGLEPEGRNHP
jgi:hypothetical protein